MTTKTDSRASRGPKALGLLASAAICGGFVLATNCSSESPAIKPGSTTTGGSEQSGGGSPATSGAAGSATGGSNTAAGTGTTAGSGGSGTIVTCPDCADSGLPMRPANTTCLAGEPPPTSFKFSRIWQGVNISTPLDLVPMPDGKTLVVAQKSGIALAIPKDGAATQQQARQFLNLTSIINTDVESGLLSMAFHPNFSQNGFVYVVYTRNDGQHSTRVARFKSNDGGQTLDLASEAKVYEHTQVRGTHHGGDMKFGPDGYLYVSFGDNNTGDDHTDFTAQDRHKIYGSVVRLDVNVAGDGYNIPADNPYANGVDGAKEVFAKGFRNPWRFSFDRSTKELWLADPGEEANGIKGDDGKAEPWEEVDRVTKGGYYGWPFFEGTHCFHDCTVEKGLPPEYEMSHNGNPMAIVGGFVYRGTALPGLVGKYVFGEYESGEIFNYDPQTKMRTSMGFGGKVVAFGEDNDGELYALRENGNVDKLVNGSAGMGGFPTMLSKTGCVDPADAKKPASGMVPFTVASPLWSDGAEKARFLALPEGKTIEVADDGDFTLPVGGVTMKNFSFDGKLFETRFFVRHNDGSYAGYSYEWNDTETDATLVDINGKDKMVGTHAWTYPSRTACFTCHSEAAGRSLGLETRQLNLVATYPATGLKANQFNTLKTIGMLSGNVQPKDPFVAKDDAMAPLETRARSYLASNCSNCHRPNGPGRGHINFLFDTPLKGTGICNEMPEQGDLGVAGAPVLKPGDHTQSVMWLRMSQRKESFMPPIGTKVADQVAADMLAMWIDSITACPQ